MVFTLVIQLIFNLKADLLPIFISVQWGSTNTDLCKLTKQITFGRKGQNGTKGSK